MCADALVQNRKVLLVEDHPMFRERVADLVRHELQMTVCGEADNVAEAIILVKTTAPDIAVVDLRIRGGSGLDFIKQLKLHDSQLPVLVLSMHDEARFASRAIQAGARGYLSKSEGATKLITAIQTVLAGGMYLSDEMKDQRMVSG